MEYISIENIRNKYPEESTSSQKYANGGGGITYKGKPEYENKIKFDFDISGIQAIGDASFKFIIDLDGQLITSSEFLSYLQKAASEGNPYFQKRTVPIIPVSSADVFESLQIGGESEQKISEAYAEVRITENINVGGDAVRKIIQHIDWLVSEQTEGLRDVKEGSNRVYGNYELYTTQFNVESDSGLGFEYTDAMEAGLGETSATKGINVNSSNSESTLTKTEQTQTPIVGKSDREPQGNTPSSGIPSMPGMPSSPMETATQWMSNVERIRNKYKK